MYKILSSIMLATLVVSCIPTKICMTEPCEPDRDVITGSGSGGDLIAHEVSHPVQTRQSDSDGEQAPRDLERLAALNEQQILAARAERIAAQFGLSTERSVELARIYTVWSKKSSRRTLSPVEQEQFALRTVGTDFTTLRAAAKRANEGDSSLLNQVADRAAILNGTSPEQMREILHNMLVD
ncbi:MAG: hypothetical protein AABY86_06135 [Bdellovibrionota bacterium]